MRTTLGAISDYTKIVEARPKGFVREGPNLLYWECRAWAVLKYAPSTAWEAIYPIMLAAEGLMGLRDHMKSLDREDSQEISEQFYSLFSDMLHEYLRSVGYEPSI